MLNKTTSSLQGYKIMSIDRKALPDRDSMSSRITSTLHGVAILFYVLAILGVIGSIIIAIDYYEFSYFLIGLGSGLTIVWLGLVLDGLYVIATNTERSAQLARNSSNTAKKNASSTVSDELPEL